MKVWLTAPRWCEAFTKEQATGPEIDGGFWGAGYGPGPGVDGNIYLGDTGTAATALAQCAWVATSDEQKNRFVDALENYAAFVNGGCTSAGCGNPDRGVDAATDGFLDDDTGAVGCGYYQGHLSAACPYIIARRPARRVRARRRRDPAPPADDPRPAAGPRSRAPRRRRRRRARRSSRSSQR